MSRLEPSKLVPARVTAWVVACLFAGVIAYDVVLALSDSSTISNVILAFVLAHPAVSVAAGVLVGHLFLPHRHAPWRKYTQWVTWIGLALLGFLDASGRLPAELAGASGALFGFGVLSGYILWPQTYQSAVPKAVTAWTGILGMILELLLQWSNARGERKLEDAVEKVNKEADYAARRQAVEEALARGDRRAAFFIWAGRIRVPKPGEPA